MSWSKWFVASIGTVCVAAVAAPARAVDVRVTVENLSSSTGNAISPVIAAAHDGSVDLFNNGAAASAGVEAVAELGGDGATLIGEITAQQASAVAMPAMNPDSSLGPLLPGAMQSVVLSLDPIANRYFSYLAMVVPSNDAFIGNDNPTARELFDAGGSFVGQNFTLSGSAIWDAGTEVNGLTGSAFVMGQDATAGTDEGANVQPADLGEIFSYYVGQTTPPGYSFSGGPASDTPLISFSFEVVPEPATGLLAAAGLLPFVGLLRRRR